MNQPPDANPCPPLYLASASPRRSEILTQIDVPHRVLSVPSPPGEDEPILPGEAALAYVQRTAGHKAERAVRWLAEAPSADLPLGRDAALIAADTTVTLDGAILGKPADHEQAAHWLHQLAGRSHEVLTAVVVCWRGGRWTALSRSLVHFRPLSKAEILAYCASGEPMGKAGGYAIQGRAATFVSHLDGSYTGVMGLPACETWTLLQQAHGC